MCEETRPHGSGCTNIGVTGRQIPSSLILFMQTFRDASKRSSCGIKAILLKERVAPKSPRLNKVQRPRHGGHWYSIAMATVDKMPSSLSSMQSMRHVSRLILLAAAGSILLLTGCGTGRVATGGAYRVTAYRPHDPSKVTVKLSTSTQNLFVMEGDRLLMAVQANVGK